MTEVTSAQHEIVGAVRISVTVLLAVRELIDAALSSLAPTVGEGGSANATTRKLRARQSSNPMIRTVSIGDALKGLPWQEVHHHLSIQCLSEVHRTRSVKARMLLKYDPHCLNRGHV